MLSSSKNASQRALDIINNIGGRAEKFRKKWLTLHAFSTEFEDGDQRKTLINAIVSSIENDIAVEILSELSGEIKYLHNNPVGNLRFKKVHPNFFRNARRDITQVVTGKNSASNRLGHLVCVVYQVRCNVEHGRKKLGSARSQKLFDVSNSILEKIISVLLVQADAA